MPDNTLAFTSNPLHRVIAAAVPRRPPLLAGTVTAVHGDGTSSIALPNGRALRAQFQPVSVGQEAFVQDGKVLGAAPDLGAEIEIEV